MRRLSPFPTTGSVRRALVLAGAGITAALTAGCAAAATPLSVAAPAASPSAAPAPADPAMIMVTLNDTGFRNSTIQLTRGASVMFMVSNRGSHPHSAAMQMPLTGLEKLDDSDAGVTPTPSGTAGGFSVTVAPGHEVDVVCTPTAPGSFTLVVDGVASGTADVG